jgi:hypothetical protein
LTDFARETAEQLDVKVITRTPDQKPAASPVPEAKVPQVQAQPVVERAYNKPQGCQRASERPILQLESVTEPAPVDPERDQATPVNRLVDMVGRIIKRGD